MFQKGKNEKESSIFNSIIFFYFGYKVVMEIARKMAITIKTTNSDKATLYAALFDEIEGLQ